LILALLQHSNLEKAAESIEISKATAWRITQTPEFEEEFRRARRRTFSQTTARLQHGSAAAATTLLRIMTDPQASAAARVRAADLVLEHAAKAIELDELEARLTELERAVESGSNHKG
jgi:DNA-binding IclR family transcriptional regulator